MLFNSFSYAVFFLVVFGLYWLLKSEYRWVLIVGASYFFYLCSGVKYGLLLLGVTVITYAAGLMLNQQQENGRRKTVLSIAIVFCLGLLFFFKYFDFFGETSCALLRLFGVRQDWVTGNIVLPVGISFYTFQAIGYVIDVYRGDTETEHHFGYYAAFISFFPQLVAGPIERSHRLLKQMHEEQIFDCEQATRGVEQMLWGYFKKLCIADVLAAYVRSVYDHPTDYKGFALVLATVFFVLQIYCDFSGYSDIAIGTAKLFGFELMTNFRSPYYSSSLREFWSRWHVSLSTWFRDYVYIPLGGNRVKPIRHYINLMITFLLSGLWHGANWTFVVWGGIHGAGLVAENVLFRGRKPRKMLGRLFRIALVFVFCLFTWVFFAANNLGDALYVLRNGFIGITQPVYWVMNGISDIGLHVAQIIDIALCVAILAACDALAMKASLLLRLEKCNPVLHWGCTVFLSLMVVYLSRKGVAAEFIYFQF